MSPRPPRSELRRARFWAGWRRHDLRPLAAEGRLTRQEVRRHRARLRVARRARSTVTLVAVAALAVFAFGFSEAVEVVVDGETHTLRTNASTVEDVLDQLEVEVGPADVVTPDLDTPVTHGLAIGIDRAITVEIEIDGAVARRITAPVSSVAGVLALSDLEHLDELGARITPNRRAEVGDGDVVRVTFPVPVVVRVDGDEYAFETFADDLTDVLLQAGVELGGHDIVLPGETGALVGPTTLTVRRVSVDEEVEEQALGFEEIRRETGDLERGTTRVEQEGREGLQVVRYRLTTVEDEGPEREVIEREVVREPQDRIVLVGTAEPPPPPEPDPEPDPAPAPPSGADDSVWDRLAQCEAGGNWSINTGNGYYGGLQFHPQTWRSVGGSGLPHEHSREEQIKRGKILQQRAGWGQWPSCSRQLGLR